MRTLIVTTRDDAKKAGASIATAKHRTTPDLQFWWPQLGHECLQGKRFELVAFHHQVNAADLEFITSHCMFPDTIVLHSDVQGPDLRVPLEHPTRFALYDKRTGKVVAQFTADEALRNGDEVALPPFKLHLA